MTTLRGVTIPTVNGVHTEPPWPCEAIPTLLRLPARSRARQPHRERPRSPDKHAAAPDGRQVGVAAALGGGGHQNAPKVPEAPPERQQREGDDTFTVRTCCRPPVWINLPGRAQRGRSCEPVVVGGGQDSLVGWVSELGKKIHQSHVATAGTMGEAFVASGQAFVPNSSPKVVKVWHAAVFLSKG